MFTDKCCNNIAVYSNEHEGDYIGVYVKKKNKHNERALYANDNGGTHLYWDATRNIWVVSISCCIL